MSITRDVPAMIRSIALSFRPDCELSDPDSEYCPDDTVPTKFLVTSSFGESFFLICFQNPEPEIFTDSDGDNRVVLPGEITILSICDESEKVPPIVYCYGSKVAAVSAAIRILSFVHEEGLL